MSLIAALLLAALPAGAAEFKASDALKSLSVSGDLRLRQEFFDKKTNGETDRSRQRLRLRLAADAALPDNLKVRMRLASGTGEQSSTNQSFDNASSQKALWIDRAYLEWKPRGWLTLQAGKQAMPLWTPYTAELVWDTDLNPEGFGQSAELKTAGGARLFANALQMVADEDAGTTADQWEFSGQLGADAPVGGGRLRAAAAYHRWTNTRNGTLGQVGLAEGNRRITAGPSAGALANDFGVAEFSVEGVVPVGGTTLTPGGTFIKNLAARHLQRDGHRLGDLGAELGARLGKAAEAGTWEAAYYYKRVEVDATPADFADADFGEGSTNRHGHILWAAYAPRDWMLVSAKAYLSRTLNDAEPPGRDHIDRYQLDLSLRF